MTLIEFVDTLERMHPKNADEQTVLKEAIENFLKEGVENPLRTKDASIKKILNRENPRFISKKDASFIYEYRDLNRFEKYMSCYQGSDRNKKFLIEEMEKYGDTFNSDQIDSSNIAVIYAHELENIIRLCRDKKQIRKKIKGKENSQIVDEDDIYSRISRVVDSLSKADAQLIRTDHQLNVKKIKEKINPDEFNLLFRKVRDNVCEYYGFVNDIFVERQKEQDVVYTAIQERIHKHYLKIADRDKPVDFHEMVDWLSKDANADSEACEIIISIFIRKCEVL